MDCEDGRFVYVPTHHQRIGRERTSLPDVSSFFQYPEKVQRYVSRDLQHEDSFQAQYIVMFTHDRSIYSWSDAIENRLHQHWHGEIIVFRRGYAGGNVVSLEMRRGDTKNILWKVVEK